ncbi:hypothetical protein [Aquimarina sediminis]|uniref:hypothetical protein n=1 Tax=Aquimarina sediminis TaxID=2070536 RepID=UPI000FFF0E2F|nr:hypothetical protein [Aquimarina sediminis]
MNHNVKFEISNTILKHALHAQRPDIMFIEIDTSFSDISDEGGIPYLNIYSYKVFPERKLDHALQTAIDNEGFGYITDILDEIVSDYFKIKLTSFYPNWPEQIELGDKKIIASIKDTIQGNEKKFEHVKKVIFNHIDDFDFVKIIDKPA